MNIQRDLQPFIKYVDDYASEDGYWLDRDLLNTDELIALDTLIDEWATLLSRNPGPTLSESWSRGWLDAALTDGLYTNENDEVTTDRETLDHIARALYVALVECQPKESIPMTPLQRELLRDLKKQSIRARVAFYFDRPAFDALATLQNVGYAKFDGQTYTITGEGRKALDPDRRFQAGQRVRLKTDQAYRAGTIGFVQRYGDPDNRHDLMYLNMGSDLLFNVGDTFLPGWQVGVWVAEDEIEIVSIPTFDSLPEDK